MADRRGDQWHIRANWVRDARELRRQCNRAHSDVRACLVALQREQGALVSDVDAVEQALAAKRTTEKERLWQRLARLKDGCNDFKSTVERLGDGPAAVKKLKAVMTTTEAGIASFCNEQRRSYDTMRREEAALTRDLAAMEETIVGWPKHPLADLDRRLAVPPPTSRHAPRRRRPLSSPPTASRRSAAGAPPDAAHPPAPPHALTSATAGAGVAAGGGASAQAFADMEVAKAKAAHARAREAELRRAKTVALKEWKARKAAEERAAAEAERAARLEEEMRKRRAAEASRARKQRALQEYRQKKDAEAQRQQAASALLSQRSSASDSKERAQRAAAYVEAAASKYNARVAAVSQPPRSEQLLLAAAEKRRLKAMGVASHGVDPSRLASAATAASVAREREAMHLRRAVAESGATPAHAAVVPSAAGAKGRSYTFGGSARAQPSWRAGR